jgi:hypothetical protein
MQELFRFYAIRTPDPVPDTEVVELDTGSNFQASLTARGLTAETAVSLSRNLLGQAGKAVLPELDRLGGPMRKFKARLDTLTPSEKHASVADWVKADFGQELPALNELMLRIADPLKDAIVALRVLKVAQAPGSVPPPQIGGPTVPSRQGNRGAVAELSPATDASSRSSGWVNPFQNVIPQVLLLARIQTALGVAAAKDVTVAYMRGVPSMGLVFNRLDAITAAVGGIRVIFPETTDTLPLDKHTLAELTELIHQVRLACPGFLELSGTDVVMKSDYAATLAASFAALIGTLSHLPGPAVPRDLRMGWVALHARLEDKALSLQNNIDDEAPASTTVSAPGPSPTVGGHMQLAGIADVHVVLNHVVRYEKAELAQVENILLGETRNRTYRTLLRSQTDTETTTETTSTQEREVKTEDRSDLKSETDTTLKEVLDLKASADIQYKQGDSLKLDLNASVAYSRSKDEANKAAADFAKDVVNRAAQKIVQTVRQSVKTQILNETEETVVHGFNNSQGTGTGTDNVVGVYQWIEKVYENAHLTVGGPAAIFDGVVLQPAQRLLTAPPSADGALGNATPPPPLDLQPTDIHPWNYLTLAQRFGATSLSPPPPFTTSTSFSAASGDSNAAGVAQVIAVPDDNVAAYASVTFDAQDNKGDDPDHAEARIALGGSRLDVQTLNLHARYDGTVLLQGERGQLPFAALVYWNLGYELTVDVTCVRTLEAYQRWQLSVYSGLATARAQAQQAYDERVARATVQATDSLGPSPGRIDELIRDEIKRCAIGVLARQAAGKNIYQRVGELYQAGETEGIARLCLLYEHAFAWENMSYVLYPYYWADNANNGWALHTSRSESDENWAAFLRAGAARVVVPVRDGFVRLEGLGVVPGNGGNAVNPLQMLQEDTSAILDGTLTFDDLLSVSSSKALSAARESALRAQVMDQWVEHEHWFQRTPTELVMLRRNGIPLPEWEWNTHADFTQGITAAWQAKTP